MNEAKKNILKQIGICLLPVIVLTLLNAQGVMDKRILPFGDSGRFYQDALRLYGQVHSGQWAEAISTLAEPSKNFFPSTFFFLFLPEQYANSAGYGLVNSFSWHLLTMAGIWIFLHVFKKERFSIPVFLLICANNYAMDPTYYYYMDFPFMGITLIGLALTVKALKEPTARNAILCGLTAAAAFLAKPPNALINTGLLACFIGGVFITRLVVSRNKETWLALSRFSMFWAAGFLPIFLLAMLCGGLESIVDVVYLNEVGNVFYSELAAKGLMRAFYFPLSLSFYYSLPLVAGLLAALIACRFAPKLTHRTEPELQQEDTLILGWLFGVFILFWGVYFSFAMGNKIVRSLTLMLPILWLLLFVATPLRGLRLRIVLPICLLFFTLPFAQSQRGFLKNKQNRNPETYNLTGDWANRWPSKRPDLAQGTVTTDQLKTMLNQSGIYGGRISVGSEMIFWDVSTLYNWCNQDSLRSGKPPAYYFNCFAPGRFTKPIRSLMENLNAMLLILEPRVQYNRNLYKLNVDLTNYALKNWKGTAANVNVFYNALKQPAACVVAFHQPLQGKLLEKLEKDLYGTFAEKGAETTRFKTLPLREKIDFLYSHLSAETSEQLKTKK